jgi:hypothetical protein
VPAPNLVIEHIDDAVPYEVVELVAADAIALRAVSALPNDGVMARLASTRRDTGVPDLDPAPMMVFVVGYLRDGARAGSLLAMRSRRALSVAIVAVDSLASAELTLMKGTFDSVVPVLAVGGDDAEARLARAVSAVTAFATANRVSIPVDEVYPFFQRGGLMTWGDAAGADIVQATGTALAGAAVRGKRRPNRVLLHVESTAKEYIADLRRAAETVRRAAGLERLELAASVRSSPEKRVSVVAADIR